MGIRSLRTASISTGTKRSKVWDQSAVILTGSFESIQTITVGASGATNISFSSIPQTYKHLQLRTTTRHSIATTGGQSQMRINGDTGANYTYHTVFGNGSSVFADGDGGYNWAYGMERYAGSSDLANVFGSSIIDFSDYSNTSKKKTVRSFGGYNANGSGQVRLHSILWNNTAAITDLLFENQGGGSFSPGTQFALYGIKG